MLTGLLVLLCGALVVLVRQREHALLVASERESTLRIASASRAGEALAVELALRWREGVQDQPAETRRAVQRVQLLAGWMDGSAADVAVARLVLALPHRTALDRRVPVPAAVRELSAWRLDGGAAARGGVLAPAAQLVGMVDLLEARRGQEAAEIRAALEGEDGRGFDPRLVHVVLAHLIELDETAGEEALPPPNVSGAVVCVQPRLAEDLGSGEVAPLLRRLEERVRERLRPSDRVYATDRDVIAWLPNAGQADAERVVERLAEALDEVVLPGRPWGPVHCRLASALAGTDGQRLPELVAAARRRIHRDPPARQVA